MSILDRLRRRDADGPMDCRAVARVLQAALDGEGPDAVADRVAEHLEACLACGMEADIYLRIKQSLLTDDALDADVADRLRAFGASLAGGDEAS